MNDDRWNHPQGEFSDEPTDPGREVPTAPGQTPQAGPVQPPVSNLGFKPQTGRFGSVQGPTGNPQGNTTANPFGNPGTSPNYGGAGSQASLQGPSSGSFAPPLQNPTGSFPANTDEFQAPHANTTGQFAAPGQHGGAHASGSFGAAPSPGPAKPGQQHFSPGAQPPAVQSGGFAPPMTGGFQAVGPQPGPQSATPGPTGQFGPVSGPGTGAFQNVAGATGAFQNVPGATGTFQAPGVGPGAGQGHGPLQVGTPQDGPPEPTLKVRATFGLGGLMLGAIVGLALGLLNSVIEGVAVLDGMSVTLQISVWFGGTIALICAWKPEKVWETLDGFGFFD
jgi:hypothetical protein